MTTSTVDQGPGSLLVADDELSGPAGGGGERLSLYVRKFHDPDGTRQEAGCPVPNYEWGVWVGAERTFRVEHQQIATTVAQEVAAAIVEGIGVALGSETPERKECTGALGAFVCTGCGARIDTTERDRGNALSRPSAQGWVFFDSRGKSDEVGCPACSAAVKVERAAETCPPWCLTDHGAEHLNGEWTSHHVGPDFGPVIVGRYDNGPLGVMVDTDYCVDLKTPGDVVGAVADLRDFAAHALSAAEWLEASW